MAIKKIDFISIGLRQFTGKKMRRTLRNKRGYPYILLSESCQGVIKRVMKDLKIPPECDCWDPYIGKLKVTDMLRHIGIFACRK